MLIKYDFDITKFEYKISKRNRTAKCRPVVDTNEPIPESTLRNVFKSKHFNSKTLVTV